MWYSNIKNSTSKMLRIAKKDFVPLLTKLQKWLKMTQNDKKRFENDANDLNTLKTSEKQSKWLYMIKNDKKWQSVIMTKSDKEWLKTTQKGP